MDVLGRVGEQGQPVEGADHVQLLVDRSAVEQRPQPVDVARTGSARLDGDAARPTRRARTRRRPPAAGRRRRAAGRAAGCRRSTRRRSVSRIGASQAIPTTLGRTSTCNAGSVHRALQVADRVVLRAAVARMRETVDKTARMRVVFATAELSPVATVGGLAFGGGRSRRRAATPRRRRRAGDARLRRRRSSLDETSRRSPCPTGSGAATLRIGTHPAGRAAAPDLGAGDGPAPPVPPAERARLARQQRALLPVRRRRRRVRERRPARRAAPQRLAHLDGARGHRRSAPDACCRSTTSPTRATTDGSWLEQLGPRAAHYEWWGDTNPLSGGIALADRVVAVSPHYACEITTPEGGFGLDGPLRARGDALIGILNGIDTDVWNPATDPHLVSNFDAASIDASRGEPVGAARTVSASRTTTSRSPRSSPA